MEGDLVQMDGNPAREGGRLSRSAAGKLTASAAQSDVQYKAYVGEGTFAEGGANPDLRSVVSIHAEPFTVVARADAGVANIEDLKGKRVNVGNPGSGQRDRMEVRLTALGWTMDDFALTSELQAAEQIQALCVNNIDAMVYTVGHPSGSTQEATTACDVVLVNVTGEAVDKLAADHPYYRHATIPGGRYRGKDAEMQTIGVGATPITSAALPDDVVNALVKPVFSDIDAFRGLQPAFATHDPAQMVSNGPSAPLHPCAEKHYREVGLIKWSRSGASEVPGRRRQGGGPVFKRGGMTFAIKTRSARPAHFPKKSFRIWLPAPTPGGGRQQTAVWRCSFLPRRSCGFCSSSGSRSRNYGSASGSRFSTPPRPALCTSRSRYCWPSWPNRRSSPRRATAFR